MPVARALRTTLERLSRGRAFRRRIEVGGNTVEIIVSPDAQLKYMKPGRRAFDADLIGIAEQNLREDSVVWDIGANVGVFTFAAAAVAPRGCVIAVEADIWLASLLRRSCKLPSNRNGDIRILPSAISSADGTASFLIARRGRASNALEAAGGHSQMGGIRERYLVPTLRLDTLLASMPPPDFVKIDVEGAELMALQGARKLIEDVRPVFYVEVSPATVAAVTDLFARAGYAAFTAANQPVTTITEANVFFRPL